MDAMHDGLAVYRFGEGQPVLLMPGPHRFARPGLRAFDDLIAGLQRLGRQVITYDPPGSGRSTRPAHVSMAEMHECAGEALDVCGVTGAVDAVGHSMGGLVVLAYALEQPQRVRRLVLVCTGSGAPAYLTAPGALWHRGHPRFPAMAALGALHLALPNLATERLLNNLIRRESFVDRRLAQIDSIAPRDWFRPRTGRADWHRVARTLDYTPRLGEIAVPTLVLGAVHDPQFPLASSQQLASRIPGAELVVFEHSGHFPNLEEPTKFWAAVGRFLDEAATSPAHERSPTWKA